MADPDHRKSQLWGETLGSQPGDDAHHQERDRLRVVYETTRERAGALAAQIERDLPEFTMHDLSHLDRLWELVDMVRGPEMQLNPAEAFVLGGAILMHDLGMATAAYPEGPDSVRKGADFDDALALALRAELLRPPSRDELSNPSPAGVKTATAQVLRDRHAKYAAKLGEMYWQDSGGGRKYLIEDEDLRRFYGAVIGRIAASHGAPAADVPEIVGPTLGAGPGIPAEWTVEPVKLACLLRIADACHIDGSRAPALLATVRNLGEASRPHWEFQARLAKPRRSGDRLVFTAGEPFPISESPAWWLAYEALGMINTELREVDSLLSDREMPRLRVLAVAGADDPLRLRQYIETRGWLPVDAQLRVNDVPSLVSSLGGEGLYGPNIDVPLRELLQNAADAVGARRALEKRDISWGSVEVGLIQCDDEWWLAVTDTGVGMSQHVLAGALLDFGGTFWTSDTARREFPGLLGSGFESIGRYGIGFFSVFMWGDHVRVTSRRYDASQADTRVLEFERGPSGRPTVRQAREEERLRDGGTRIEVRLNVAPNDAGGLLDTESRGHGMNLDLPQLCAYLAPAYSVKLTAVDASGSTEVSHAGDWLTLDGARLIERVTARSLEEYEGDLDPFADEPSLEMDEHDHRVIAGTQLSLQAIQHNLRVIVGEEGEPLGRACVVPSSLMLGEPARTDRPGHPGVVTIGGLRAGAPDGFAGVLAAQPLRAARDQAAVIASPDVLAAWASEQAHLLTALTDDPALLLEAAQLVYGCGGDVRDLPIAHRVTSWLQPGDVADVAKRFNEVVVVSDFQLDEIRSFADGRIHEEEELELADNVLVTADDVNLTDSIVKPWPPRDVRKHRDVESATLAEATIEALAQGWSCGVRAVQLTQRPALLGKTRLGDVRDELLVASPPGSDQPVVEHQPRLR